MALKTTYFKTQLFSMLNFKTFSVIIATNFVLAACDSSIPTKKYNSSPFETTSPSSTPWDPTGRGSLSSMPAGEYLVRRVWYDEQSGEYKIEFLSNSSAVNYRSKQSITKLAPLTATEIAAGKKSFVKKSSDGLTLHLAKSFKINFIPAEAETAEADTDQTSLKQIPWSPFTGNQISSTPQFYFPPIYNNTSSLSGYSSSGKSYSSSLNAYTAKYQTAPRSVTSQSSGNSSSTSNSSSGNNSISKTSSGSNIGSSSSTKSGGSSSTSSGGSTSRGGFGSSGGSSSSS
jgi:hypothetical protein